jgi:hypothetical protein
MKHIPVVAGTIPSDAIERLAALPIVSWVEHDFPLEARRSQGGALIDACQGVTLPPPGLVGFAEISIS